MSICKKKKQKTCVATHLCHDTLVFMKIGESAIMQQKKHTSFRSKSVAYITCLFHVLVCELSSNILTKSKT